ncbi:transporter substrate-binding domain-containing protein [Glaciimonas sp. Gout2]|uniref:transporter substrate-binding domain-containing protein n=1 Tax=unclassified Glaciimonas TaxID=2644401 RepID=UPI002B23ACEB|nr:MULTISPECIES: transporter substrate-binding domain-containing protein [unclassified Glaciimonas]MEB0012175.1 transporter substrate-binding domain-containing protein [Glaciimonas sp. Cout2]MEB0082358.1 transporter substrate-binding domain-containing protein [Glaciimonas sp. Gout2]
MKKRNVLSASLLALCLLTLSSFSTANTLENIQQRKKILIAVDIGAPPYGMLDGKAKQSGSDIETAQLLAKDLGVELEVVPVSGPNRVPFLLTKKADLVIASFSITDARKKVIDFSNPYGVIQVVVGGPVKQKIGTYTDLIGKTVAVTRGTTSDMELTLGVKEISGVNIVRYEDDATTNTAVSTGQQDYLAAAMSVIPAVKKANPSRDVETKFIMKTFPLGIGIRKNDAELKAYLDKWVQINLKNGKLNEIYKKYFGVSLPADMLN